MTAVGYILESVLHRPPLLNENPTDSSNALV
jgi:hypothetical protein